MKKRCHWAHGGDVTYILYHDKEWGEKRVYVASQDLEQFLRKVYSVCKTIPLREYLL